MTDLDTVKNKPPGARKQCKEIYRASEKVVLNFSKYRLKNSFKKIVLNHDDVLDIKYSMEEINEFIRAHFS